MFDLPSSKSDKESDRKLVQKAKESKKAPIVVKKGGDSLIEKIQSINEIVRKKFGGKEEEYILIQDEQTLIDYIDTCILNNIVAIDTETTGLDPILDKVVGVCLYTPGKKACYIPVGHIDFFSMMPVDSQLSYELVGQQLQRLVDNNVKTEWFNAPFDVRFIKHSFGVFFTPWWDASIASRVLNSAEPVKKLKVLHNKYCGDGSGEVFNFDDFFNGTTFDLIPIKIARLYAANDAIITHELCEYQKQFLLEGGSQYCEGLAYVFNDIEMKSMPTFIEMEENGVRIDYEWADKISAEYHELSDKMKENLSVYADEYAEAIEDYKRIHPNHKLSTPINLGSNTQLGILLYDIIGVQLPPKTKPYATDSATLKGYDLPLCKAILDMRAFDKALSTYIDKIPEVASSYPDKRIHCRFNQYGADTGRVSSNSPNLQNIPSRPFFLSDGTKVDSGHDIRQLFTASEGCVLLSCDYSGQEVRVTAHLSKDEKMIDAYRQKKDVYSEIASLAYGVPYEDCCEKHPDGTDYAEGKRRRGEAKKIVLGVLYGRGIPSIAEQLAVSVEEAQAIYDKTLEKFEGLAQFIKASEEMARKYGYVDTVWGRRRQLQDMMLPPYSFKYKNGITPEFDPLSDELNEVTDEVPYELCEQFLNMLATARTWKARDAIKEKIKKQGIIITDNNSAISQAQRQCVNARVQGSSADLTKKAQIELFYNQELRDLGFKMLIPVHDEIIGECPKENVVRCAELMSQCMLHAGSELCVPLSCDVAVFERWYGEELDVNTLLPIGKH